MFEPFKLKSTLGRDYLADEDDTLEAKKAFKRIGYMETPSYGLTKYPDEPLFKAIEEFQNDAGLMRDGVMKPDGETANALGFVLKSAGSGGSRSEDQHHQLAARGEANDEKCHKRWNQEHARCYRWRSYGTYAVRGCIERATDRLRLCIRNGYPEPYEPTEWSPKDMK